MRIDDFFNYIIVSIIILFLVLVIIMSGYSLSSSHKMDEHCKNVYGENFTYENVKALSNYYNCCNYQNDVVIIDNKYVHTEPICYIGGQI